MENENTIKKVLFNEISFVIAVIGVVIGVFVFLTDPSTDNNIALQLQDQRITAQRLTIDELTLMQQNEIKEVKGEITGLRVEIQALTNTVVKLSTIIEERIPASK
jgi:hypothetical protein